MKRAVRRKKYFSTVFCVCFCLYHRLFTSRLSITPDFVEFITDLFVIVSDFIMGYPGPDRDCLGPDLTYLRFYCHDPVDRSVKLIYQKLLSNTTVIRFAESITFCIVLSVIGTEMTKWKIQRIAIFETPGRINEKNDNKGLLSYKRAGEKSYSVSELFFNK